MAARPFRVYDGLPEPLTVEETGAKFGVSATVVDAAKQILVERTASRSAKAAGRTPRSRGRKPKRGAARKRAA